jgi:hypothetical protein
MRVGTGLYLTGGAAMHLPGLRKGGKGVWRLGGDLEDRGGETVFVLGAAGADDMIGDSD